MTCTRCKRFISRAWSFRRKIWRPLHKLKCKDCTIIEIMTERLQAENTARRELRKAA